MFWKSDVVRYNKQLNITVPFCSITSMLFWSLLRSQKAFLFSALGLFFFYSIKFASEYLQLAFWVGLKKHKYFSQDSNLKCLVPLKVMSTHKLSSVTEREVNENLNAYKNLDGSEEEERGWNKARVALDFVS